MAERDVEALLDGDGPAAPPRANGELVFAEPWESRVFGLAVSLRQRGLLDWERFRERLIAEIAAWERAHGPEEPYPYYACWRRALEGVLAETGHCAAPELDARHRALAARPPGHDHG